MAKAKKRVRAKSAPQATVLPSSVLAPQVLEKAAQGWLQSAGTTAPFPRPSSSPADDRLTEALADTLQELRREIAELRGRLDRLESR